MKPYPKTKLRIPNLSVILNKHRRTKGQSRILIKHFQIRQLILGIKDKHISNPKFS